MAVWSTINLGTLPATFRLDAEYYQPAYLSYERETSKGDQLAALVPAVMHPIEITRVYSDSGLRILLAQNIRQNYLDLAEEVFMPPLVKTIIARNLLKSGDVLMTRSGANFGDTACYLGYPAEIFACADCLILRPASVPPAYLSTFFNTDIGRGLLTRGAYGMAQPHISPTYLRELRIPRLGDLEATIQGMIEKADALLRQSIAIYQQAESALNSGLGLDHVDLSPRLFYEDRFSQVAAAGRFDAEYYQPRYQIILKHLNETKPEAILPFAELLTTCTNGHTPLRHDLSQGEIPFLTAEHVTDFQIDYGTTKRILDKHDGGELARTSLKNGDILVTIKGRVGNAAVVEDLPCRVNINQDVALIRVSAKAPAYFITAFLNSIAGKIFVEQLSTNQINPFLSLGNLKKIPIPLYTMERMDDLAQACRGLINKSRTTRTASRRLLDTAKRAVEISIEDGEAAARKFMEKKEK